MKAARAFFERGEFPDGAIVEMTIWRVAVPLPGSGHAFQYHLFHGYPGKRLVAYDNERGQGDHRHIGNRDERYVLTSVAALVADFLSDVRRARGES